MDDKSLATMDAISRIIATPEAAKAVAAAMSLDRLNALAAPIAGLIYPPAPKFTIPNPRSKHADRHAD